jgi:hypothetical protein
MRIGRGKEVIAMMIDTSGTVGKIRTYGVWVVNISLD